MLKKLKIRCAAAVAACAFFLCAGGCGKADGLYDDGNKFMDEENYKKAAACFKDAIGQNPENAEYYIAYGMALNGLGRYDEAVKSFDAAYQDVENAISKENNKKMYFGKAAAYYGLSEYDKALEACDAALAIDDAKHLDDGLNRMKAVICRITGDFDSAVGIYGKLIEKNDDDVDSHIARGEIYEQNSDYEKAKNDYLAAVKIDEKNCDAYFLLYEVYKKQGDEKNADGVLNKILEIKSADAMQKGRAYYYKGDYENALAQLDKSYEDGEADALYYSGLVEMAEKDFSAALEKFKNYTGSGTKLLSDTYNQMAGCCIELGDFDAAMKWIEEGLGARTSPDAERALMKNKVVLYERMGRYRNARRDARSYIKKFPDDDEMKKELAFINSRVKTMTLGKKADSEKK